MIAYEVQKKTCDAIFEKSCIKGEQKLWKNYVWLKNEVG